MTTSTRLASEFDLLLHRGCKWGLNSVLTGSPASAFTAYPVASADLGARRVNRKAGSMDAISTTATPERWPQMPPRAPEATDRGR